MGSFFTSGQGAAAWTTTADAPGDTDGYSVQLTVPNPNSYAGFNLANVPAAPPATPPSFAFMSSISGNSGGSPRLVIDFSSTNSNIQLRPLTWTANTWTTESGASNDWDSNGGTCGFRYEVSYATAVACHGGETVVDAYVVSDEFAYPNGFVHYIDDVSYGGSVITSPVATSVTATPVIANIIPGLMVYIPTLNATLTGPGGVPIPGQPIVFTAGGNILCSATTGANGVATCSGLTISLLALLSFGYTATFAGNSADLPSAGNGPLLILAGIPI